MTTFPDDAMAHPNVGGGVAAEHAEDLAGPDDLSAGLCDSARDPDVPAGDRVAVELEPGTASEGDVGAALAAADEIDLQDAGLVRGDGLVTRRDVERGGGCRGGEGDGGNEREQTGHGGASSMAALARWCAAPQGENDEDGTIRKSYRVGSR